MAWSKKTWLQNIVEHPGRRLVAPTGTTNIYDVTRAEGTVVQAGDQFSVTNMNNLETRIDTGFSDRDAIVGALASLTTSVKTSIVNAINSLVTERGSLSSLTTTVKTSIVNAINEVNTKASVVEIATTSITVSASSGTITVPSNQVIYSIQNASAAVSNDAVTSWQRNSATQVYYNKAGTSSTTLLIAYKP